MFKAIRPKVRPFSIFGDDNLAKLDAQVDVLENDLNGDDISDKYDRCGSSEEVLMSAFHALDWLNDDYGDEHIAEDWPLEKTE